MAARQEPEPIIPALAIQDIDDAERQLELQGPPQPFWYEHTGAAPAASGDQDAKFKEGFTRGTTGQYRESIVSAPTRESLLRADQAGKKSPYINPSEYELPPGVERLLREAEGTVYGTYSSKNDGVIDSAGIGHELQPGEELWDWSDPALVEQVFQEDIKHHAALTLAKFPNLPDYEDATQLLLMSDMYSGLLGQSPRTRAHIRSERWEEAIEEYKDSYTWRKGMAGQKARMAQFIEHMKTLKSKPLPKHQSKNYHDWYEAVRKKQGFTEEETTEPYTTPSGRAVQRWIGPDHRRHRYDYYQLYLDPDFDYTAMSEDETHLPSKYKHDDHPNIIVEGVNTKTGESVEPY